MIIENIRNIYNNLMQNEKNPSRIKNEIINLEKLLLNKRFSKEFESSLVGSKEFQQMLPQLQRFYEIFEVNLENEFTVEFLSGRAKVQDYLLYKRFVGLVKNEIKLANISKNDKVLFIGNGPMPITAILLNKFLGCKVDCYDKDKTSCVISRKVIKKLRLENEITIYNKRGEEFRDKGYYVIIVALLAKPKEKILRRIWKNIKSGTIVVCRDSDGVRQVFYEKPATRVIKTYMPNGKIYANDDQTISSVLLTK